MDDFDDISDEEALVAADVARNRAAAERYKRQRETQSWKSSHVDIQLIGDRIPSPVSQVRVDQILQRESDDIAVAAGWERMRNG